MKNLILRIVAVFALEALGTIGAASILGTDPIIGAAISGILAVSVVFRDLAKSFLEDGKLTKEEIDRAFKKVAEGDE